MINDNTGKKVTAKQWAAQMIFFDLDNTTDYYYERWPEYNKMTEKEQEEVRIYIQEYHDRITEMVYRSLPKHLKEKYLSKRET